MPVMARVRSTRPPVAARLYPDPEDMGRARVVVDQAEAGVSPGQACVLYQGSRVLGGGWIHATGSLYDWDGGEGLTAPHAGPISHDRP